MDKLKQFGVVVKQFGVATWAWMVEHRKAAMGIACLALGILLGKCAF